MPYVKIDCHEIYYVERQGSGDALLFIHGIPVNSSLWDEVISKVDPQYRVFAPDLIGFGKSSKPMDIEYNLDTYTQFIKSFADKLELKNIIIVGMDLGLMIGLNYFACNSDNVKGLVMFEGMISDISEVVKRQSFMSRLALKLFGNDKFARKAFVDNGIKSIQDMLKLGTVMEPKKLQEYLDGFENPVLREKILVDGVCSNSIAKGIKTSALGAKIHCYSEVLRTSSIPKLLLYANPGAAISKKMVKYATMTINNLETTFIGKGKHFIPFDQPENIAMAINRFMVKIDKS